MGEGEERHRRGPNGQSEGPLFSGQGEPPQDDDPTLFYDEVPGSEAAEDPDQTLSLDVPYSISGTPERQVNDRTGEDATVELPGWRDPPTGEIPRIIEELAGEPLPRVHEEAPTNFDALEDREDRSDTSASDTNDDFLVPVERLSPDRTVTSPPMSNEAMRPTSPERTYREPSGAPRVPEGDAPVKPPSPEVGDDGVALQRMIDERRGSSASTPRPPVASGDTQEAESTRRDGPPEGAVLGRTRHEVMRARRGSPWLGRDSVENKRAHPHRDHQNDAAPAPERDAPVPERDDRVSPGTDPLRRIKVVRTITGVVLALVFIGALKLGTISTLVVVVVAVTTAAAEGYNLLRRGGYRPAALVGLLAVIGLVVGAYVAGEDAIVLVIFVAILASLVWFMVQHRGEQFVVGVTTTMVIVVWVGLFGAFAGLLLRHALFGDGGLGLLIGALLCATTADVFAFFGGSLLGKHKLAPAISPGKTVEGVLIGGAAAILVGAFALPLIHPFTLEAGVLIGVASAIIAPVGDLAESALKRSVSAKDSSRLLPGHGGMLDRIDGILIVLPVAFYLFLSLHLR
ncbi:phosphatidate cytidylyltransferase [Ferrimicrobium sp.]|uniref:phosphatidate cytidylyltransferase n=1 Tax=Ferrimicrobium sp. TaxID=2926050 RepID=UPI00262CE243|nr:phosphatidate cytidylyltransferase [Ferrimicrobium sp.]